MDTIDKIIRQWQAQGFAEDELLAMACIGRIKRTEMLIMKQLAHNFKQSHNLASWEFDVLATLKRGGAPYCLSPTELFASMMVTSGAMTNRLNQLEKKNLIKRVENKDDGRSLLVQLTKEGLALIDKAIVRHIELENQLLAGFDKEEILTLNKLLKKLGMNLATDSFPSNSRTKQDD